MDKTFIIWYIKTAALIALASGAAVYGLLNLFDLMI